MHNLEIMICKLIFYQHICIGFLKKNIKSEGQGCDFPYADK